MSETTNLIDEKIIIEKEHYHWKNISKKTAMIIFVVVYLIALSIFFMANNYYIERYANLKTKYYESEYLQKHYSSFDEYYDSEDYSEPKYYNYGYGYSDYYNYGDAYHLKQNRASEIAVNTLIPLAIAVVFDLLIFSFIAIFNKLFKLAELTVTNKRIYGRVSTRRRVDLPLDSISSVGLSIPKAISVGTSSGRIRFQFVKNRNKIHDEISKLLVERQGSGNSQPIQVYERTDPQQPVLSADELKKYKELLDMGAITQDEYDSKKKQILGI